MAFKAHSRIVHGPPHKSLPAPTLLHNGHCGQKFIAAVNDDPFLYQPLTLVYTDRPVILTADAELVTNLYQLALVTNSPDVIFHDIC